MRQRLAASVLVWLLLASTAPLVQATDGRSSGVDLAVEGIAFSYSTSTDEGKYRMFSSNHPIPGFNRPASLFVIDAMVNVPIEVDVTVANRGNVASSVTDVRLLVLHDEYQRFEIVNLTEPLNSVSGRIRRCCEISNSRQPMQETIPFVWRSCQPHQTIIRTTMSAMDA